MDGQRPVVRRVVVGAAIVCAGRVLAARRTTPAATAGRWEFPGGKVEPDETPEQALVRELVEELGVEVEVTGWLTARAVIDGSHELRVATARLVSGTPSLTEHDELRWLAGSELGSVDWLEPDRPFLEELGDLLAQ